MANGHTPEQQEQYNKGQTDGYLQAKVEILEQTVGNLGATVSSDISNLRTDLSNKVGVLHGKIDKVHIETTSQKVKLAAVIAGMTFVVTMVTNSLM